MLTINDGVARDRGRLFWLDFCVDFVAALSLSLSFLRTSRYNVTTATELRIFRAICTARGGVAVTVFASSVERIRNSYVGGRRVLYSRVFISVERIWVSRIGARDINQGTNGIMGTREEVI